MTLTLVAVLGWGISGLFAGRAAKSSSPVSLLFWSPIISLPLLLLPIISGVDLSPDPGMLLFAGASGGALFLAWACYLLALRREDSSPVVAISSVYPLFSLLIFVLIGQEIPRLLVFLGIFMMCLGIAAMQLIGSSASQISRRSLLYSLLASLAWGLWGFFDYKALQYGTPFDLMFWTLLFSVGIAMLAGVYAWRKKISLRINRETVKYRSWMALSSTSALLAFYYALGQTSSPSTIIAMTAAYPLVTMLLAVAVREERFYRARGFAVALIVLGVACMNLS